MSAFSPRRANLDARFSSYLVTAIPVGIRQTHQVDEATLMSQFERAQQKFFDNRGRCGSIAKEAYCIPSSIGIMPVVEALPVEGKGHQSPDLLLWRSSVQDYVRDVPLVYARFGHCAVLA